MHNLVNGTAATPTYDTSAIMRAAWVAYDKHNCLGDRSRFKFNRVFFAQMLAATWKQALSEMKAAKLAALQPAQKSARLTELKSQLNGLDFLPIGMNASTRAAALKKQISQLAA